MQRVMAQYVPREMAVLGLVELALHLIELYLHCLHFCVLDLEHPIADFDLVLSGNDL